MGLTRLSLRRPLTMLMIILALVVMGYRAYTFLQLDLMPEVDFPVVTVVTVFPGASPEDIEELVVKPIEDAVATISGIDDLVSTSNESVGSVIIVFDEGIDGSQAAIDVERQVASVQLPDEAEDPTIIKADINAFPIMVMSLNGPQSQDALFELADQDLKPRFQAIPGVTSVSIAGGREREIQVNVDPAKLAAYNLPLSVVQQALAANNVTFPAGSIEAGRWKTTVRSVGEFSDLTDIENIVIIDQSVSSGQGSGPGGGGSSSGVGKVYLRDVATVEEGLKDQDNMLRYNGREAVSISTIKASDANTVEVADSVRKVVEEINQDLPAGAELLVINDNSEFIQESVDAVIEDLILAILITGLIMLFFLHTIRSTFIVLLAIPTSIIATFLVMWALGFSLNQLTLMALTLVIGILVDDSIVVIENIERHISQLKKPPKQAALDGRREIGFAAITITLVDVVVYLPVAFMSGIVGQFFYSYGVTIAVAALFSLFIAFTLTPLLAAYMLKDESQPSPEPTGIRKVFSIIFRPIGWLWNGFVKLWDKGFDLLSDFYGLTLRFFLWSPLTQLLAVAIAIAALVGGVYMVFSGYVGFETFPQQDDGQIRIDVEMPPGTNLAATDEVATFIENLILNEVPETSSILTRVGGGSGGGFVSAGSRASNVATVNIKLVDLSLRDRSTTDVVEQLRPLMAQIPEAIISVSLTSMMGGGGGDSPIQIQIYGDEPEKLIELADEAEAVISTVPGVVDVKNTGAARAPETLLQVDRERAQKLGLSPFQVAGTLRTALSGSQAGKYKPAGDTEVDITMRLDETARSDLEQLLQMPMSYVNGQPIVLERVVNVENSLTPATISRSDRQRVLTVGSGISGRAVGDVTNDVEAAINEQIQFPVGYGFRFVGQSEMQREIFSEMLSAIALAILLVYMLLVALYQSWLQPLAIMFSLPVTLVGAIGGLYLTGNTLNMLSLLGIVLLTGVVTKNAILVVDFTNLLRREQGLPRKEALVQAGRLRLRAVLMTTFTLVFALLPLVLGAGAGSEFRAPLAAVVIGGSISSTALTLILVPVIYNFFDWGGGLVSRAFRSLFGLSDPSEQPPLVVDGVPDPTPGTPPPAPQPQPGAAISMNPSSLEPEPDAV